MTQQTFHRMAGTIFLAVAVLHLLRLLFRWEAVIGGWAAPGWMSVVALIVAGYLAYTGFRLKK